MKNKSQLFFQIASLLLVVSLLLAACDFPSANTPAPSPTATATQADDDTDTPEPTKAPSSTPVPTTAPSATPMAMTLTPVPTFSADAAAKALVNAFKKLATAYPYRLVETTRGASTLDRTTDFAAADRIHSSWVLAPNPDQRETVTIGGQTWWKINGKWDTTPSDNNAPVNLYALLAPNLHDVGYAGQETVNGTPSFVFSYTLTINTAGVSLAGSGKAWVGVSDGLPHQLDLNATASGLPLTTRLVYSYGVKLDIQQPVP